MELGREHGLPPIVPLDEFGNYVEGFDWLSGRNVYDIAEPIIESLRRKGRLYHVALYTHRYPVCWRCSSELVFRLVDEWFISMDGPRRPITDHRPLATDPAAGDPAAGRDCGRDQADHVAATVGLGPRA